MNEPGKHKVPIIVYPCLVGLCLFLTAAIVGYSVTQSWVSFVLLAGYAVFAALTFVQGKLITNIQSLREAVFVFNLLLFIKTAVIFCMFLLPGAFGNIHYGDFIHVFHTVLLFGCVVFLIINFYFEKIYLIKRISESNEPVTLKDGIPVFLRHAINYYPLIYSVFIFATVIIYILAMGVVGPIWLISGIAVYSLFNAGGYMLLLGNNKLVTDIFFAVLSLAKYAITLIIYLVFVPSANSFMETTVFVNAYTVLEYTDLAVFCISIVIDAFAAYFIFRSRKLPRS